MCYRYVNTRPCAGFTYHHYGNDVEQAYSTLIWKKQSSKLLFKGNVKRQKDAAQQTGRIQQISLIKKSEGVQAHKEDS